MPTFPYLKIDHVDKTFTRGTTETEVLKDITLGIEKGEYVSIIGHSGCGKSTLLNLVAGLLPVSAGCVLLENKEVNDPGPDRHERSEENAARASVRGAQRRSNLDVESGTAVDARDIEIASSVAALPPPKGRPVAAARPLRLVPTGGAWWIASR